MARETYNPATTADAEQHAQEEMAESGGRALRRPAAGAGLAAALASAWLFVRRAQKRSAKTHAGR
jgi:hypothetical protein